MWYNANIESQRRERSYDNERDYSVVTIDVGVTGIGVYINGGYINDN